MIRINALPRFDFDVAIVGAGPAGAATAAYLARSGLSVGLLDTKCFPRDKVCGDFVSPAALRELDRIGVSRVKNFPKTNQIHSAAVFVDGQELLTSPIPEISGLPSYGRVIPRITLDQWILESAHDAGATVLEGHRVRNLDVHPDYVALRGDFPGASSTLYSRVVIGADGSNSLIARCVRGRSVPDEDRIVAIRAYFEGVDGPPDRADLYFNASCFPGYYWVFPTGRSSANVGVGILSETLPRNDEHLRSMLLRLISEDSALRARLHRATLTAKVTGWPLTTYNARMGISADRVLLVGDAAGLINPLNGEGIQYGLLSARYAAETVVNCVARNDFSERELRAYSEKVHGVMRYDMALARIIVQLIRNRSLNPLWLQALKIIIARARVDPRYADVMGGVLAGLVPAAHVINPRIVADTVKQAMITTGFTVARRVLRGPKQVIRLGGDIGNVFIDTLKTAVQTPDEFLIWSLAVGTCGMELVGQMVSHAVAPTTSIPLRTYSLSSNDFALRQ